MGIHQLNTIRQVHKRNNEQREIYVLIIATPATNTAYPHINRVFASATLHDILVLIATSPEDCAKLLVDLETGKFGEDDESQIANGW